MKLKLKVWRQAAAAAPGRMVEYDAPDVSPHMSFLEMLDVLNERLVNRGEEPIAFDHDCREGICGTCGFVINGIAHGGQKGTTVCQLHMRHFKDGDELTLEPWRSRAFPVLRDLMVDRSAFDRIIQAGGFVSVNTGTAPDGNAIPIPKIDSDLAMDAAQCIGCGACVAQCPNGAAQLFTSARSRTSRSCPRGSRALPASGRHGRPARRGDVRQLHQLRRVRSGLPEADLGRFHRPAQPRLPQGEDPAAAPGKAAGGAG
jgi:succinate dehydrogenase / fumarate reductase iron-sulfur subunit